MFFRWPLVITLFLLSACTFTSDGNMLHGDFHPPIVSQPWEFTHYTLQHGVEACGLSSGYNGVTAVISQKGEVAVQSTREVKSGATFTIQAGGPSFETGNNFFPEKTAEAIVSRFQQGGKGYLEWSEIGGPTQNRIRVQNIIQLNNFKAQWQQCKNSLASED